MLGRLETHPQIVVQGLLTDGRCRQEEAETQSQE